MPTADTGAGTSLETFDIPFACSLTALRWACDVVGSGAGTLRVTVCKVTLPSTVVETALEVTVDVDSTLDVSDTEPAGSIACAAGDRIAVKIEVSGTVSGSPTRPRAQVQITPT